MRMRPNLMINAKMIGTCENFYVNQILPRILKGIQILQSRDYGGNPNPGADVSFLYSQKLRKKNIYLFCFHKNHISLSS